MVCLHRLTSVKDRQEARPFIHLLYIHLLGRKREGMNTLISTRVDPCLFFYSYQHQSSYTLPEPAVLLLLHQTPPPPNSSSPWKNITTSTHTHTYLCNLTKFHESISFGLKSVLEPSTQFSLFNKSVYSNLIPHLSSPQWTSDQVQETQHASSYQKYKLQ